MHTSRSRTHRRLLSALGLTGALIAVGVPVAHSDTEPRASVYYVSPDGDDSNDGSSPDSAWSSLNKVGQAALEPGDTIRFERGGTWNGGLELSGDGAKGNPIVVNTYGEGARPIIGGDVGNCVTIGGNHWVVRGLRASDCNWAGFEFQGNNNELRNVYADHNVVGVSIPGDSAFNLVQGSELINNNKMSVNTPGGDDDSGAFGVLLNGDDNTITQNTISGSFADSYDYGVDGAAVEVYNGDRNTVTYNHTSNNVVFTELGRGEGETSSDNVFAYNLVTTDLETGAFLVTRGPDVDFGPVTGTVAVNNTVRLPAADTEGWVCHAGCSPEILQLRNNVISVGGQIGYEDGQGADEDTSVYQGNGKQFELGPNSVQADPGFVSGTDLHLTDGSPAIGRGEALGYDHDLDGNPVPDNSPDAGAYQFD